jgi:hypothetical protein
VAAEAVGVGQGGGVEADVDQELPVAVEGLQRPARLGEGR